MSSMSETTKQRSGAWYLLPIFLTVIGGIIAYFVIKNDDPKKAKNCLYLGIALTAAGIGLTVISGAVAYNDVQKSQFDEDVLVDNLEINPATSSEVVIRDNSQINELAERMEYDYNVFGLRPNYIQLHDVDGNVVTEIKKGIKYAIVSEIQNRDDVEKKINYSIDMRNNAGFAKSKGSETVISPYGTLTIDYQDIVPTTSGIYDVDVWLDEASTVEKASVASGAVKPAAKRNCWTALGMPSRNRRAISSRCGALRSRPSSAAKRSPKPIWSSVPTIRLAAVPMAAPCTPSAGRPSRPKISG